MEKSEKRRYTYRKVGKMRIKMRSRVHIFLFGVSEFHPCLGDMGIIECVTFRLFSFEKEVSAYAETLIKSDLNFCIVQIQVHWALPKPVLAGSRAATRLLPVREDVVRHSIKSCPGA